MGEKVGFLVAAVASTVQFDHMSCIGDLRHF